MQITETVEVISKHLPHSINDDQLTLIFGVKQLPMTQQRTKVERFTVAHQLLQKPGLSIIVHPICFVVLDSFYRSLNPHQSFKTESNT